MSPENLDQPDLIFGIVGRSPKAARLLIVMTLISLAIPTVLWMKAGVIGLIITVPGVLLGMRKAVVPLIGMRVIPGQIEYFKLWLFYFPKRRVIAASEVKAVNFRSQSIGLDIELHNGEIIPVPFGAIDPELAPEEVVEIVQGTQLALNVCLGLQPSYEEQGADPPSIERNQPENSEGIQPDSEKEELPVLLQSIDIQEELAKSAGQAPRHPKVAIENFGMRALRRGLETYNDTLRRMKTEHARDLYYYSLARECMTIAEIEYALGYPVARVREILAIAAVCWIGVLDHRESREYTDVQVTRDMDPRTGILGPEKLESVVMGIDDSIGNPNHALLGVYCAEVAGDRELSDRILELAKISVNDRECFGVAGSAEIGAHLALFQGDEETARALIPEFSKSSARGHVLRGILHRDKKSLHKGIEAWVQECERNEARNNSESYAKKGKRNTPQTTFWSLESMGSLLLARRYELRLSQSYTFVAEDMLTGCDEKDQRPA